MRTTLTLAPSALLAVTLLATACATTDPPAATAEPGDAAQRTAADVAPVAPGETDERRLVDADNAVWGVALEPDRASILAFLSTGTTGDAGSTRAVSFSEGAPAPAGHVVTALRLRGGKLLAGRVVADDGETVTFDFTTADGLTGRTRVPYTDIHPESVAELMLARADQSDAAELIDIAEYAAGERLFEIARVHYLAAAEADESVASVAEKRLRDLAAQVATTELARAEGLAERGDDRQARRVLRRVQREYSGTDAADTAAARIDAIDSRLAQQRLDERREKLVGPVRTLLDDAERLTDGGLAVAHESSKAVRSFMAARSKAESARRRLVAARDRVGDDDQLSQALEDLEERLKEQQVDNETHLAAAYLDRGDFRRARQAANAVLTMDGRNREALSLLGEIRAAEEARRAETYDAWWYRYRRQHGVYPYPRRWVPHRGQSWGSIRREGVTRTRAPIGVFRR